VSDRSQIRARCRWSWSPISGRPRACARVRAIENGGRSRRGLRAAIYARISSDREGDQLGVRRQVDDCEQLSARKRWEVVERYVDDDVSAYRATTRPSHRRMLDDIQGGFIDAVVVWHLDRLHRQPRELEEFSAGSQRIAPNLSPRPPRSLRLRTSRIGNLRPLGPHRARHQRATRLARTRIQRQRPHRPGIVHAIDAQSGRASPISQNPNNAPSFARG
jgi:resolvase-like protein